MRLAVYREDGNIYRVHSVEDVKDYTEGIQGFTRKYPGKTVEIEEHDEGSVVAYLYAQKQARKKELRDELLGLSADINGLDNALRYLSEQLDGMED